MDNKKSVTSLTRNNWLMDFGLFLTAIVTVLSGVYFLFLPDGGFKGGRNPLYGIRILFLRETWEWLHTWIGLAMVVIALVHIIFHWKWVKSMFKRVTTGASAQLNPRALQPVAQHSHCAELPDLRPFRALLPVRGRQRGRAQSRPDVPLLTHRLGHAAYLVERGLHHLGDPALRHALALDRECDQEGFPGFNNAACGATRSRTGYNKYQGE